MIDHAASEIASGNKLSSPGKAWSVEHGHWHDAPFAQAVPTHAPATPAPAAVPAEKKQ